MKYSWPRNEKGQSANSQIEINLAKHGRFNAYKYG